jgi:hypothetical protein
MTLVESLPTFINSTSLEEFRAAYDSVQCVCFKQAIPASSANPNNSNEKSATVESSTRTSLKKRKHEQFISSEDGTSSNALALQKVILDTFNLTTAKDQDSWVIENGDDMNNPANACLTTTTNGSYSASDFLSPAAKQNGYCSFVMQDDSNQALSNFAEQHVKHPTLPIHIKHATPAANDGSQQQQILDTVCIADPYWIFVGRNNRSKSMKGRNEHTDDIQHNGGTFHYQVSGSKTWTIRPTEELRDMCDELDVALKGSYVHTVEEGDIFVINTRLWWHQTEIPGIDTARTSGNTTNLSISYARDIYLDGTQPPAGDEEYMSSKDGAWAIAFIAKGTILFTEDGVDPPASRTSKLADANCIMKICAVEDSDNEDGVKAETRKLALVAIKDIKEGEFFTILENGNEEKEC